MQPKGLKKGQKSLGGVTSMNLSNVFTSNEQSTRVIRFSDEGPPPTNNTEGD